MGEGLAQLPGSNNALLAPIQISMIVGLGKVFDKEITESFAKSLLASQLANIVVRTATQLLLGWIPILGNSINAANAGGLKEAIGCAIVNDFADN